MKKIIVLAAALFVLMHVQAQGFQLGLKAGANLSKVTGVSFQDQYELGYHAGAFTIIKFGKVVGLQPEILFNQFAATTANEFRDIYDGDNLKQIRLSYLTIPMLVNVSPMRWVSLQGGAQMGILMDKEISLLRNGEQAFKKGELSLLGGVQLNLGIFKIGGRYFHNISNANDIDGRDPWRNRGYQLSVGVRII
jgi:hypothetical protein